MAVCLTNDEHRAVQIRMAAGFYGRLVTPGDAMAADMSGAARPDQSGAVLSHAISAITGFAVCLAITLVTGRKEAWDASAYFAVGMPLMCVVIFAISYRLPRRAWRWTLSMVAGQAAAIALGGGSLSLWPLAIVAMTVVSIPQFVTGIIASRLARQPAAPDDVR